MVVVLSLQGEARLAGARVDSTVEHSLGVDMNLNRTAAAAPPPTEISDANVSLEDSNSKPEGRGGGQSPGPTAQLHSGTQADTMPSYFLAPHVYPCITEGHLVLLDLEHDKYVGVAREQLTALARRVRGWSRLGVAHPSEAPEPQTPSKRAESVFAKMINAGMLTTDADIGKEVSLVEIPAAAEALVQPDLDWRPRIAFRDVVRFLLASMLTSLAMRVFPLRSVMTRAMKRKAEGLATAGAVDIAIARRATEAFIRLRPLLFAAQDACLYDSLALTRFLSYYRQFPACVIGVQTGPFGAHCWVQEAGFVFNDAPEYVRRFTPIFAV